MASAISSNARAISSNGRTHGRSRHSELTGFSVFETNAGRFFWRLLDGVGDPVAVSTVSFGTEAEAQAAAADVHSGLRALALPARPPAGPRGRKAG